MKKGFTLAEVLITLGIIGVIAAVSIPAISNMFPDQYKTRYMKAYKTLTALVPEIMNDEELYWTSYYPSNDLHRKTRPSCEGLTCRQQPKKAPYNTGNANTNQFFVPDSNNYPHKFTRILASMLNLQSQVTQVQGVNNLRFTTQDGTRWVISVRDNNTDPLSSGGNSQNIDFHYFIYIDVDSENQENRDFYGFNNVTRPHRFAFDLNFDGKITPMDRMGKAYLLTSTDNHHRENDKNVAEQQTDDAFLTANRAQVNSMLNAN